MPRSRRCTGRWGTVSEPRFSMGRAEYGAQIVAAVGRHLEARYGRGFGEKNLRRMVQFATVFPEAETVAALRRQLTWAHFKLLIPLKDSMKREFYAEMCRVEGWSTRVL